MPPGLDEWSGRLLAGRYRLGRKLGQGAFGVVYQALDEELGRVVAVKLLHEALARDPIYLKRFRREAIATAKLDNPRVVQVTDFQEPAGEPAIIVMEYLQGETLAQVLRREVRLAPPRALFIVDQVLSGLGAAHRAGIAHRDLKPGNVFVTEVAGSRDVVKIVDFGIAKRFDGGAITQLTRTGVLFGSPGYIAPEQIHGLDADARSDVFAVGVVLYRCLVGKLPFDGDQAIDRIVATVDRPTPSVFTSGVDLDVDRGIDAVIGRALEKHPEDRFQTAQEMRESLAPLIRGLPGGSRDPTARGGAPRPPLTAEPRGDPSQQLRVMPRPVLPEEPDRTLVDSGPPRGLPIPRGESPTLIEDVSSDAATLMRDDSALQQVGTPSRSPRGPRKMAATAAIIAALAAAGLVVAIATREGWTEASGRRDRATVPVATATAPPDAQTDAAVDAGAPPDAAAADARVPVDAASEPPMLTARERAEARRMKRRGHRLLRARRWQAAERAYRRAFEVEPSAASAAGVARALGAEGDTDEGVAWARRAIELAPDSVRTHLLLGDLLARSGDPTGAREAYLVGLEKAGGRHRTIRARLRALSAR